MSRFGKKAEDQAVYRSEKLEKQVKEISGQVDELIELIKRATDKKLFLFKKCYAQQYKNLGDHSK